MILAITITTSTIITVAAVLSAAAAILGAIFAAYRWYLKQEKQDEDIAQMKEENRMVMRGILASLDGLEQLGCNHSVPQMRNELEEYINQQAHK